MKVIDRSIIDACIRKERNGQKALYSILLPMLKPIVSRYLRNNQYILDVLQESFVQIFRNIDKFEPSKGNISSWASKIVINTSLNYNCRIIGINTYELENANVIAQETKAIEKSMCIKDLKEVLQAMPKSYYHVFNLYIIDGYDHEEIAQILDISTDLSRKKLSRARNWIKNSELMRNIVVVFLLIINCL